LGYSCLKFDPVLAETDTLNENNTGAENTLDALTQAAKGTEGFTDASQTTNVCGGVDTRKEVGSTEVIPEERTDLPTYLDTEQTEVRVGGISHRLMIPNTPTEL